ncbi:MAG: penicillin-binding transpeptidase domain-containing protein, partial [Planctomycetota bacterium]
GDLLDRNGTEVAVDEPTTQVLLYYRQFRRWNVVGAALHGAQVWQYALGPHATSQDYAYQDAGFGPDRAVRDLLAIPVAQLQPGALTKALGSDLRHYVTVVLAGCAGLSRRQVYTRLREAWERGARVAVGDVLANHSRALLLQEFERRLVALERFGEEVWQHQLAWAERSGRDLDRISSLFELLDRMRRNSLLGQRIERRIDGKVTLGAPIEEIPRVFAPDVPFELGARLRIESAVFDGVRVEPAVRRTRMVDPDSAFADFVGKVSRLDLLQRAPSDSFQTAKPADADAGSEKPAKPPAKELGQSWIEKHLEDSLPPDWISRLVPEGLVGDEDTRLRMLEQARRRYGYEMLVRERRGRNGLERAYDDTLVGTLGMRFVEHDSRRREHLLWSNLSVEPGKPVRLSFDVGLQAIAEAVVRLSVSTYLPQQEAWEQKYVQAAVAVIDAHSGDILALAGAPLGETRGVYTVPGISWRGNGSLGSVVKPFVMIEQLDAMAKGRPHMAPRDMKPCRGEFEYPSRFGRVMLRCDHTHHERGRDPVLAIAESCNIFFYQAAYGLGTQGVHRALRRFGLLKPDDSAGAPLPPEWQGRVPGLPASHGRLDVSRKLPNVAIGYGVETSPLWVARAYAALATGALPTVGTSCDERRPVVPLVGVDDGLRTVRQGLRECLTLGSGNRDYLSLLRELEVYGKTGTAEVSPQGDNNAWFAGYLPWTSAAGVQLAFCAVVYRVPDSTYGAAAGGGMLVEFFRQVRADPVLRSMYLQREGR